MRELSRWSRTKDVKGRSLRNLYREVVTCQIPRSKNTSENRPLRSMELAIRTRLSEELTTEIIWCRITSTHKDLVITLRIRKFTRMLKKNTLKRTQVKRKKRNSPMHRTTRDLNRNYKTKRTNDSNNEANNCNYTPLLANPKNVFLIISPFLKPY